ncbi:MAG: hypothetical protein K5886_10245 [Lachnospiraceae bacterium]|nr:hypothetical protein [Lachnospiraceae bacterium]
MSILSVNFIIFFTIIAVIFFLLPGKLQWLWLLVCSMVFYYVNAGRNQFIAFLIIMAVNWAGSFVMSRLSDRSEERAKSELSGSKNGIGGSVHERDSKWYDRQEKRVYVCVLLFDIFCLVIFKYIIFIMDIINAVLSVFNTAIPGHLYSYIDLLSGEFSPPRISYFMLIIIGYITEVHWGRIKAFMNPGRLVLLASYFPLMTSGPIIEYSDVEGSLFGPEKHRFSYDRFVSGMMRILWGCFKKLVISERLAMVVNTVYADYEVYSGFYIWVAVIFFAMQLYTDFSGLMDIVLGMSEILSIDLPENFDTPFYSVSLAEFWRRWHITLGGWLKTYVFFPVQRTKAFSKLRKFCKKKLGKGYEKKYDIPQFLGLLISWFLIGLWHGGGWNYIFGVGLYMGVIIILSELLKPVFIKLTALLKINTDCFSYRLFRRLRTFVIFVFGLSFFRAATLSEGFRMWKYAFTTFNPWIFFDRSLYGLGVSKDELLIAVFGLILLLIVSFYKHRESDRGSGLSVRALILKQNRVFILLMFVILFVLIITWGYYGSGYDASDFIYGRF